MPVPVFRPFIKRKDMDAVLTSLVSDSVNSGLETELFIDELLEILDLEVGIGFREVPRAIQTAIAALELQPSSRIGVSILAPLMYDQAIRELSHIPVYIDCFNNNPCLDHIVLQKTHNQEALQAVIVNSSLGYSPDLVAIRELKIPIIMDLTESFQGTSGDIASFDPGDIAILGLEATGILTAGGGAVVFSKSKPYCHALGRIIERYPREVYLQDMNAALGRAQLKQLDYFLQRRQDIFGRLLQSAMRGRHQVLGPVTDAPIVPFTFPLLIQSSITEVQSYSRKKNVETISAFGTSIMHTHETRDDFEPRSFPNAYGFLLRCLLFPLYPGMSLKELEMIEKVLASLP